MQRPYLLVVILSLVFAVPDARAADRQSQERAAQKACLTGDATKGTDILADLYIDTKNPVYIYNQGRCFEQSSRYEEAIARFHEYLRKATTASPGEKSDAEKHIADCEALLARAQARAAMAQPAEPAAMPTVAPEPQPPVPILETEQAPATQPGKAGSGLRTAGVVTAAVGGATLIAALALNLKVNGMIQDLRHDYDKNDESSSKTYKTLSQVGYGVGAALVAGGAVLYYLGRRAGARARLAVLPSFAAGTAGAVLQGAF
jgi:tetratricopeptide (TPR) repeat protein